MIKLRITSESVQALGATVALPGQLRLPIVRKIPPVTDTQKLAEGCEAHKGHTLTGIWDAKLLAEERELPDGHGMRPHVDLALLGVLRRLDVPN